MRHLLLCCSLFILFDSQAQQVNPVPDYVFRNQMSVGRNAVTDTAAYISIGPRYGANKGLMPPIVSDTAAITGVKRNGLLIFSVQRNGFRYWDSINSKWASVTASVDTTVIATRAWRQKGDDSVAALPKVTSVAAGTGMSFTTITSTGSVAVDSVIMATRARVQKAVDSLGSVKQNTLTNPVTGTGTTNYVPKFTGTSAIGNSEIFQDGTNIAIGRTIGNAKLDVQVQSDSDNEIARFRRLNAAANDAAFYQIFADPVNNSVTHRSSGTNAGAHVWQTGGDERMRLTVAGRLLVGTSSEGTNTVDIAGNLRTTTGANFATSSGSVGIGTTTPGSKFEILDATRPTNSGIGSFRIANSTDATRRMIFGIDTTIGSLGVAYIQVEKTGFANMPLYIQPGGGVTSITVNVGIGTTSPSYKLDVTGDLRTTTGANFATSSGEVLIATLTDAGDYKLQVNGNANFRDDVLIDTNLRVNRHIALDQTLAAWSLGNAVQGPQGGQLFLAGGGVQALANVYYDGAYKYTTSNPGAAMFLLQSGITFATYGSGTANGSLTGANEMVYAGGELRVGLSDQGTFKLQVADKSYFGDEVQIASTTDLGNYKLQVTGDAILTGSITTGAPTSGTAAAWKLGTKVATSVQLDTGNYIEVEVGGNFYRLAIVTPL